MRTSGLVTPQTGKPSPHPRPCPNQCHTQFRCLIVTSCSIINGILKDRMLRLILVIKTNPDFRCESMQGGIFPHKGSNIDTVLLE